MKALLPTVIAFLISSCAFNAYEALNEKYENGLLASRKRVREIDSTAGGTGGSTRSDGSSRAYDNRDSFQDATILAGGVANLHFGAKNHASDNTLSGFKRQADSVDASNALEPTIVPHEQLAPGETISPTIVPRLKSGSLKLPKF